MKKGIWTGFLSALLLSACHSPEPVTYEAVTLVNKFYAEHPVASLSAITGSWLFRGARPHNGQIKVGFLLLQPLHQDAAKRQAILDMVCPPSTEKIWDILPEKNKILIEVWTKNHKFTDSTTC